MRKHKVSLYAELLTTGKLNDYLADLNEQAEAMFSRLVKQFSEKEGVTEALFFGKSNAVGAEGEQQMAAFPFQAVFNKS
ncbi:MAG: TnpV protein [Coprococcus sp.]